MQVSVIIGNVMNGHVTLVVILDTSKQAPNPSVKSHQLTWKSVLVDSIYGIVNLTFNEILNA